MAATLRVKRRSLSAEGDIIKVCLQWLTLHSCFVWRQNQGAFSGEYKGRKRFVRFSGADGIADIIGLTREGRFLAIEVKQPGKKARPNQEQFLESVRRHGGIAGVVHDLDELQALIVEV